MLVKQYKLLPLLISERIEYVAIGMDPNTRLEIKTSVETIAAAGHPLPTELQFFIPFNFKKF